MKRIEFVITDQTGQSLKGPAFVDHCSELPMALKQMTDDFLEAHGGELTLPITIQVRPASNEQTC